MKRLLCIVGSMNAGGAETFLMKIYRKIDRNQFQMDFAVTEKGVYDDEIRNLGGIIHIITPKSKSIYNNLGMNEAITEYLTSKILEKQDIRTPGDV